MMKKGGNDVNCFKCKKRGHYSKECPEKYNKGFQSSPAMMLTCTPEFEATHCPCGAGLCVIRASSKSNGLYYSCPGIFVKETKMMCHYFKWCDDLKKKNQILRSRPPFPYPICYCGAGISRLEIEKYGRNAGRKYFACYIKKGDGACNMHLWQDVYNQSMIVAYEINMIREAVENGQMEPDFPNQSQDDCYQSTLVASEVNMIMEALVNGEIALDFPEEAPDEMEIYAPSHEIFAGDYESSAGPSLRTRSGSLSGRRTDNSIDNYSPSTTFADALEDLASLESDDDGWWV